MDINLRISKIRELRLEMGGDSCETCRPVCQAICCRYPWKIRITQQEFLSGYYDALQTCSLSGNACDKLSIECKFRTYQLKKKEDNSCIYLGDDNLCKIHDTRPQVCREFNCGYEFGLNPVESKASAEKKNHDNAQKKKIDRINDQAVYISHPLVRLITVIYQKDRAKLYFVKELIGNCGKFYSDNDFIYPQLDDAQIHWLIHLFDKKEPLSRITRHFQEQYGAILSEKEFKEIVLILLKHNIIINVKHMGPLLKGIGL
jgi:Fe-S-cluster containining protein